MGTTLYGMYIRVQSGTKGTPRGSGDREATTRRSVGLLGFSGILLAAALVTAGCGDLPLFPGELALSPDKLTLEEGTDVVLTRTGGYAPVELTLAPSAPVGGSLDSAALEYVAPTGIPGNTLSAAITATDLAGAADITEITVFKAFSISPVDAVVPAGGSLDFAVVGGVADYVYTVVSGSGDISPTGPTPNTSPTYTADPGVNESVLIRATDSVGNAVEAMITVVDTTALLISPTTASVAIGGTQSFVVFGGAGAPYTVSVDPPGTGSIAPTGPDTFDYQAPLVVGEETVRVKDLLLSEVTAQVSVISVPLTLSPSTIETTLGQQTTFTADGGVAPYSWSVDGAGTIEKIDANHAVYTAPAVAGFDWVKVTDDKGKFRKARVYVK